MTFAMGANGNVQRKPILLMTHPRSRSTAFERMFLTQSERILCMHEIFQHPFYYGSERLSSRLRGDEIRSKAGNDAFDVTYKQAFERIEKSEGRRVFVKDMAKMFMAPQQDLTPIAPSLQSLATEADDARLLPNPTCVPLEMLRRFHFTFLIRHPRLSIPSLYRLTQPPLAELTGWHGFSANDAGYVELRRLFDFLRDVGVIGPKVVGQDSADFSNGHCADDGKRGKLESNHNNSNNICVIDSESLHRDAEGTMRIYCREVGEEFDESMLVWGTAEERDKAEEYFKDCRGFHMDLLKSAGFAGEKKEKQQQQTARSAGDGCVSDEELYQQWTREFGAEAAKAIWDCVEANMPLYHHLRQYCINT